MSSLRLDQVPRLSIIVPAYNVETYIGDAIASLRAQTFAQFEIIIIDDGSTDGTGALADALAEEGEQGYPRIRVIHQTNKGASAARNAGIRTAKAPLIGFLDGDDRWWPGKIVRHLEVLDQRSGIDLTSSWWRITYEEDGEFGYDHKSKVKIPSYEDLVCANVITLGTVIARTGAIRAVGGFDETLAAFEDWDLWLRMLKRRPGSALCIQEVLADYRQRDGQATSYWRKMDDGWRQVMEKQRADSPELIQRLFPRALAGHLSYCSMLAFKAGDHKALRQLIWQAWKTHPATLIRGRGSRWITQVALATLLPRPIQTGLRRLRRVLREKRVNSTSD